MTTWAVGISAYGEQLIIDTPTGERLVYLDPHERGGYIAPLDIVSGVALRDLVRALRSEHADKQLLVSRQSDRWFDPDTADPAFALRPGEPRRFELEFIFGRAGHISEDEAEGQRLAALLAPLATAQQGRVASVKLHPDAFEPPWPYVVVLSLPLSGWTVDKAARLVDNAVGLLAALSTGEFNRNVALQVLRANHPEALLGQHETVYLDVKQSHYDLDTPHGEIALAQAVARFANAETGGLLVVGMRGKKVPGGEVISKITPVAVTRGDVRRYRLAI
jgi:hypothetical protein